MEEIDVIKINDDDDDDDDEIIQVMNNFITVYDNIFMKMKRS